MNEQGNFYRIKTEWTAEKDNGSLEKTKTEEFVFASCYTDAEKTAYALIESENRDKFGTVSIEIVKTKIGEFLYNDTLQSDQSLVNGLVLNYLSSKSEDSESGIYSVKAVISVIDERSGKEKKTTETIYTPAVSNQDASNIVSHYYDNAMASYVIRDIKFDKAVAVLWAPEFHQSKVSQYDRLK